MSCHKEKPLCADRRISARARSRPYKPLKEFGTLLLLIAEYADTKSLQFLAQGRFKRRNIHTKNRAGLRPIGVALHRRDIEANLSDAFFNSLSAINTRAKSEQVSLNITSRLRGSCWVGEVPKPVKPCIQMIQLESSRLTGPAYKGGRMAYGKEQLPK